MTREQIINQYISVYEGHAMEKEELEIMLNGFADDIVNNLQPSLPDNLDEAAEEYLKYHKLETASIRKLSMYRSLAFKAGAEWMAGKGYTVDGIVICDKELTRGYKDIVMSIPDELKVDDEVTIQIRKREEK